MIFCQYKYKEYNNLNKDVHPIQGYDMEGWCRMVKDNEKYCKKFGMWRWIVFYYYHFFCGVDYVDLPSFHPYWRGQTKRELKKKIKRAVINYKICQKDDEQIKYLYNTNTTIEFLEKEIIRLKQKRDEKGV